MKEESDSGPTQDYDGEIVVVSTAEALGYTWSALQT